METVRGFIFLGSNITADGDCSHGIKRRLLLGRKAMMKLDSILKSKDITLSRKVRLVKAMVFPVFMYRFHEIKRRSLLGRKIMTNLDSIFKSRDITLPTNVHRVKAAIFPVFMYGCESWTIKKAGH